MNCPHCGHADAIPVNIQNTFLECTKCRFRYHISGIVDADVEYVLDPRSPLSTELELNLKTAHQAEEAPRR